MLLRFGNIWLGEPAFARHIIPSKVGIWNQGLERLDGERMQKGSRGRKSNEGAGDEKVWRRFERRRGKRASRNNLTPIIRISTL